LPAEFPFLSLQDATKASDGLSLGDPIYIGGYPGIGADTFTFTQGVVSGRVGDELIKTSALIDSGTSGGAAFDSGGTYVGVPTAAAKGEIGGSLGYLIGANVIDRFIADFLAGKNKLPAAGQMPR
jgi:S1-C subfamily serine protease